MSTQDRHLQDANGAFLVNQRALNNPGANILETTFGPQVEVEEWTDWMLWDVGAVENALTLTELTNSFESTRSICDTSITTPTSIYSTKDEYTYEDALFEFDEPIDSAQFPANQMLLDPRKPTQGYHTLTAAEQQALQAIAMPYWIHPQTKIELSSPTASSFTTSRSASPEAKPATRKSKKRKLSVDNDDAPNALCQSRRRGHNEIEKRYRTNLNDKISCLREGIPPLWRRSSTDSKSGDEVEDSNIKAGEKKECQKYGKAAVLTRALEYIQYLEGIIQKSGDEVEGLKTRVGAFERLAMSGSVFMSNAPQPCGLLIPRQTLLSIQDGTFLLSVSDFKSLIHTDVKQIKHKSEKILSSALPPKAKSGK
jgi:hypothetical protein